jgi:hypothetical protein
MRKVQLLLGVILTMACSNPRTDGGDLFFPQLAPASSERAFPSALADGTLILEGGCLRLQEGGYLILWPPQVSLSRSGESIQVVDAESGKTARVGEKVRLGGGEVQAGAPILNELREPVPDGCPGPYWLASGILSGEG